MEKITLNEAKGYYLMEKKFLLNIKIVIIY